MSTTITMNAAANIEDDINKNDNNNKFTINNTSSSSTTTKENDQNNQNNQNEQPQQEETHQVETHEPEPKQEDTRNEEAINSVTDKPIDNDTKDENSPTKSDLSFAKKDLSKSRTQSFQSVLSTASLKSLKQQVLTNSIITNNGNNTASNVPQMHRNNSTISTHNLMRSNSTINNSKNFLSFIQAPVLSSIQKPEEDCQIGQQLPFDGSSSRTRADSSDETDEDNIAQQQNLTLKALKKLSLSPRPVTNPDDISIASEEEAKSKLVKEPYQPAEVDLSSFASLTRQPKQHHKLSSPSNDAAQKSTGPIENPSNKSGSSLSQYHNDIQQNQLNAIQRQLQPEKFNTSPNASRTKHQLLPGQLTHPQLHQQQQQIQQNQQQQQHHHPHPQSQTYTNFPHPHPASGIPAAVVPPTDFNAKRKPLIPKMHFQQQQQQQQQQQVIHGRTNISPESPTQNSQNHHLNHARSTKHLQQIKGLRNPMYVPAVLRVSQNGLSTPSRSQSNSPEDLSSSPQQLYYNQQQQQQQQQQNHQEQSQDHYESYLQAFNKKDVVANSSNASVRSTDSGISIDSSMSTTSGQLGSLTGFLSFNSNNGKNYDFVLRAPPTRKHWIKDEVALKCGIPTCPKVFNFFERRHHCRKCGGIFCKQHTSHSLYINHLAQFTTGGRGTLSKVCDNCIEEYNQFIAKEFGVNVHSTKPSITESSTEQNNTHSSIRTNVHSKSGLDTGAHQSQLNFIPTTPTPTQTHNYPHNNASNNIVAVSNDNGNSRNDQLVGSVPANWTWSSF